MELINSQPELKHGLHFYNLSNENDLKFNNKFIQQNTIPNHKVISDKYFSFIEKKFRKQNFTSSILKDIHHKFLNSKSLDQYLENLFKINYFKSFKTIHLIIHEKGKVSANHLEFKSYAKTCTQKDVSEFNKLFFSIKKSKNRSFGQSTLKGLNFEILGTIIAREFSLPKYNVIFLLSKDDFLPQSQSDIDTFNIVTNSIPEHLNHILNFEYNQKLIERIQTCIQYGMFSVAVSKRNKIYYQCKNHHNFNNSINIQYKDFDIVINENKDRPFDDVDIFHKERITLLGDLLNTLRHELSNPLFGLKLSTELMLIDSLDNNQTMFIQEIHNGIVRCNDILHSFSTLYNHSETKISIDIVKLVDEVFTLTKSATRQIKKIVKFDNNCEKIKLISNETWIVQILFNLIINSAQELLNSNTIKPQIIVEISKQPKHITLKVIDNGPAVSQQNIKTIFNAFYTTKNKGTGLGLYISKNLAKKLSGDLRYINQQNKQGAIFELSLPLEITDEHISY